MRIYIGGPNGVGKTTLAREVAKLDPTYRTLSGSEVMMKACGVGTREELMYLDPEFKAKIEATKYVEVVMAFPNLIMDGHFVLCREQMECFDRFILMVADPRRILELRIADHTRRRELQLEDIRRDLELHIERAGIFKAIYPDQEVFVIENNAGLGEAVREFKNIVSGEGSIFDEVALRSKYYLKEGSREGVQYPLR